jgi:hypothetical protein
MLTFLEFHEVLLQVRTVMAIENMRWHGPFVLFFVQFVMFKLYHGLGLAYPPAIRAEADAVGGALGALDVAPAAAAKPLAAAMPALTDGASADIATSTSAGATAVSDKTKERLASLKGKLKELAAAPATAAASNGAPSSAAHSQGRAALAAAKAAASTSIFDFVDLDEGADPADEAALSALAEFQVRFLQ